MMTGDIESTLLQLIAAETNGVKSLSPYRALSDDPHEWAERYGAIKALPIVGVKIGRDWIGGSDSQRKARQRGLRRLETLGLVELFAVTGRGVSHVRLTEAGLRDVESRAAIVDATAHDDPRRARSPFDDD